MMRRGAITEEDLQIFADGRLGARRAARVARHLRADPQAAERVGDYIRLDRQIRQAYDEVLQEPVPPQLRRLTHGAVRGNAALVRAAMTLAFSLVLVTLGWRWMAPPQAPAEPQTAAGDDFTSYVIAAHEAPHRGAAAVPSGNWNAGAAPPDLSAEGFGKPTRRQIVADQRSLVEYAYHGENGEVVHLYVDRKTADPANVNFLERGERRFALWQQGGVHYALVGHQSIPELARLVREALAGRDGPLSISAVEHRSEEPAGHGQDLAAHPAGPAQGQPDPGAASQQKVLTIAEPTPNENR